MMGCLKPLFPVFLLWRWLHGCEAFTTAFLRERGQSWHTASSSSPSLSSSRLAAYQLSIEYCPGCKWGLRSFWMAQELLSTFNDDDALEAVSLIAVRPPAKAGSFVIKCIDRSSHATGSSSAGAAGVVLWDRTVNGGFPEMKELKQLVRDHIDPELYLGSHIDHHEPSAESPTAAASKQQKDKQQRGDQDAPPVPLCNVVSPSVAITYCTGCHWLLRAAYMEMELLSTFGQEINSFSLIPSRPPAKGGTFRIALDGEIIWDRETKDGFPPVPELKQLIRDRIDPAKDLGHSDTKKIDLPFIIEMENDDDDASMEARKFFGVA